MSPENASVTSGRPVGLGRGPDDAEPAAGELPGAAADVLPPVVVGPASTGRTPVEHPDASSTSTTPAPTAALRTTRERATPGAPPGATREVQS
jgi:hypothetical protein